MFMLLMCIQWLLFLIINGLYYYLFYVFWNDYLKDNREESAYFDPADEYRLWWSPDWGVLLVLIISWYQMRLMYFTYKSM